MVLIKDVDLTNRQRNIFLAVIVVILLFFGLFYVYVVSAEPGIDNPMPPETPPAPDPQPPPNDDIPGDFRGYWRQQIKIVYADGSEEFVEQEGDTLLSLHRFGKEIAYFQYIIKIKVEPATGIEQIFMVPTEMRIVFNENGYITKKVIEYTDVAGGWIPADNNWHFLIKKDFTLEIISGGTIQVSCERGGPGNEMPYYVINEYQDTSKKYYPNLPTPFSFQVDELPPNDDFLYESQLSDNNMPLSPYIHINNKQYEAPLIQSFKIGATGPYEPMELDRIEVKGTGTSATEMMLFGYYSNGPNGLPWYAPPLPTTIATVPLLSNGNGWLVADFSDENIEIQPGYTHSIFITGGGTNTKISCGFEPKGNPYPGGLVAKYIDPDDNYQGNTCYIYYAVTGGQNYDLTFKIWGNPT